MKIDVGTEQHIPNFSANFSSIPFIPCQIDLYFLYAVYWGRIFKKNDFIYNFEFCIYAKNNKNGNF